LSQRYLFSKIFQVKSNELNNNKPPNLGFNSIDHWSSPLRSFTNYLKVFKLKTLHWRRTSFYTFISRLWLFHRTICEKDSFILKFCDKFHFTVVLTSSAFVIWEMEVEIIDVTSTSPTFRYFIIFFIQPLIEKNENINHPFLLLITMKLSKQLLN